jgi:hypothetical protein
MRRKSSAHLIDFREVEELILKILSRNRYGLSPDMIRKDLPSSHRLFKDQINSRLKALLSEGKVYSWNPPAGSSRKLPAPIYSLEPLQRIVVGEVQEILTDRPLSPAEIKTKFPAHIKKYILNFLDPLIKNKTIKWHPPLKGKLLGLQDPDPGDFLSSEIKKLFDKGEKLGFQVETVLQAAQEYAKPGASPRQTSLSTEETEKIIFKAMKTLKPAAAQGALVYIPDLRKELIKVFPDKDSFDNTVLNLAKLEKVQLQSHSLPDELTKEEQQAMIDNQRGSYFMAIGIRME